MFNVSFPNLGINDLTINRTAFSIGSFSIYWYGILIASGLLLAVVYAYFNTERYGVDRDKLFDCVIAGIVVSIVGARFYYVAFKWDYFSHNLLKILDIRDGGIAIYGAIIGALVGGLTMAKIKKQKFLPLLDITMPGFFIGQAIGRWGNFFNQEAYGVNTSPDYLFGMVSTNLKTGVTIGPVHPCFLYESVWCALGFLLLHIVNRKFQRYHGMIFYLYLVWYGFERMIVEGLRTDSLYLPFQVFGQDVRVSQVLSACLYVAGIILLFINRRKDDGMRKRTFNKPQRKKKALKKG